MNKFEILKEEKRSGSGISGFIKEPEKKLITFQVDEKLYTEFAQACEILNQSKTSILKDACQKAIRKSKRKLDSI